LSGQFTAAYFRRPNNYGIDLAVMRVAFITLSVVPFGSNDLLMYRAAETLSQNGHQVLISPWDWGRKNSDKYELIRQKGAAIWCRSLNERSDHFLARQWQKLKHQITDYEKGWHFIDQFAADAIVISDPATYHMCTTPGLVDYLLRCEVPIILISQYNDENTSLTASEYDRARSLFGRSDRCVFVSKRNLEVAERQLSMRLSRSVVVDNPPNLENWDRMPFPRGETIRLAMVARLESTVKGQALVLQALAQPEWASRDWELDLFGAGPDERYVRDLIRFLGLESRVRLRGYLEDIRSIWCDRHLLIMGSSGEGKPLALTEAMLCGRPAVVTDVGGNAELIQDQETGFVAESATLPSLAHTLDRAWCARDRWEEMGRRAHAAMIERLTPSPGEHLAGLITALSRDGRRETRVTAPSLNQHVTESGLTSGQSRPLVSIVIPCFNAAATIGSAIESALRQSNVSLDVLVIDGDIDGGSTDDSLAIVRSFEPRVRVLSGPNQSISAARNRGIAETTSEWIVFLDADDLLLPETLRLRLETAEATGADVVVCDWQEFFDEGGSTLDGAVRSIDLGALKASIGTGFVADIWATTAALLYRRSLVEKIGGFRENVPEDARFLSDAAYHRASFAHSPHLGARHRISPQSHSRRDPARFWRYVLLNGREIHALWQAGGVLNSHRMAELAEMYNGAAQGLFRAGDPAFWEAVAVLRTSGLPVSTRNRLAELLSDVAGHRRAVRVAECWTKSRSILTGMFRTSRSSGRSPC
jgi:glycosyltransferase involved in cell wall biosynthesis